MIGKSCCWPTQAPGQAEVVSGTKIRKRREVDSLSRDTSRGGTLFSRICGFGIRCPPPTFQLGLELLVDRGILGRAANTCQKTIKFRRISRTEVGLKKGAVE